MSKMIKISVWVVCFLAALNTALKMISEANSIENIIGFIFLVATILVSVKTRCFTNLKSKKDEKFK